MMMSQKRIGSLAGQIIEKNESHSHDNMKYGSSHESGQDETEISQDLMSKASTIVDAMKQDDSAKLANALKEFIKMCLNPNSASKSDY